MTRIFMIQVLLDGIGGVIYVFIGYDFNITGRKIPLISLAEARFERCAVECERTVGGRLDFIERAVQEVESSGSFQRADVVVAQNGAAPGGNHRSGDVTGDFRDYFRFERAEAVVSDFRKKRGNFFAGLFYDFRVRVVKTPAELVCEISASYAVPVKISAAATACATSI